MCAAATTTIPHERLVPRSRVELAEWIGADLAAHGIRRWRWYHRFSLPVVAYQRRRRQAEYLRFGSTGPVHRALGAVLAFRVARRGERLGFSIPLGTVGPGLRIAHVGTVVVHVDARIGAGCTLSQGVSVGEANGRVARVGDGCHLAPNSVVLGARLGDRVGVWANAVVTHDAGDGVSLRGVPARPVERTAAGAPGRLSPSISAAADRSRRPLVPRRSGRAPGRTPTVRDRPGRTTSPTTAA